MSVRSFILCFLILLLLPSCTRGYFLKHDDITTNDFLTHDNGKVWCGDYFKSDDDKPSFSNGDETYEVFHAIIDYIPDMMDTYLSKTVRRDLYLRIVNNPVLKTIVLGAIVLYVSFIGIGFLTASIQHSRGELLKRVFIIGVVVTFFSSDGLSLYTDLFENFFLNGTKELARAVGGALVPFGDPDDQFIMVKIIIQQIANGKAFHAIALMFAYGFIFGIFMAITLLVCLYQIFKGVLTIFVNVVGSYFFILVLLLFGPLLIPFLMFEKLKFLFYNWLGQLISFSLQYAVVLVFMNIILYLVGIILAFILTSYISTNMCVKLLASYQLSDSIAIFKIPVAWLFMLVPADEGANLFDMLTLLAMTVLFSSFADKASEVANAISGVGNSISQMTREVQGAVNTVKQAVKRYAIGPARDAVNKRIDKVDQALTGDSKLDGADDALKKVAGDKAKELDEKGIKGEARTSAISEAVQEKASKIKDKDKDGSLKTEDLANRVAHHTHRNKK